MGVSGQIPKLPRCSVDNSEVYSVSQTAPSESKPLFLHIAADGGTFMSASSFPPSLSLLLYLCFLNTSEMNQLLSNPAPELLLRNPNLVAEFILLLGHIISQLLTPITWVECKGKRFFPNSARQSQSSSTMKIQGDHQQRNGCLIE